MVQPSLFETVVLPSAGYENAPKADVPYYLIAQEATFLVKQTQIGQVILPEYKKPTSIPKLGYAGGVFTWQGERIPGAIISQAHDFFLRIFKKHGTEAEVLITKHNETGAFRLFVPYQRANGMGVKSIYEPTHIDRNYTVVGTLHSHCNMGAFHSGTDSGDASDMDGVHFTIGKVTSSPPEIVGMVAMNGKEFHYKDLAVIAEVEFGTTTAPPWWDTFMFIGDTAPKVKPASLISLTQEHWDEFLGRALVKPQPTFVPKGWTTQSHMGRPSNWTPNTWSPVPGRDFESTEDWRARVYGGWKPQPLKKTDTLDPITHPEIDAALDIAVRYNVWAEEDWDDAPDKDRDNIGYWRGHFIQKLDAVLQALELLGVEYAVTRLRSDSHQHETKKGKRQ